MLLAPRPQPKELPVATRFGVFVLCTCAWPALAFAQAHTPPAPPVTGYGTLLLKMILALGVVCLLAVLALKYGLKRFLPTAPVAQEMEIVARMPLEPRRALLVVRVGPKHLILASSEAGISAVGELSAEEAAQLAGSALPTTEKAPRLSPQAQEAAFSLPTAPPVPRAQDDQGHWITPEE